MATIDLNSCFPEGKDGTKKPLPKQAEFLRELLNPRGPKYVCYVGGIGSGKSLIGCVGILTAAVLYPGDYLISRQFLPQLKDTTYKTFLEICPSDLIIENRVADLRVTIKASGGKVSNIFFRQLEEPEKLKSMNLSGFLIDEADQVSEESFLILQGRLRGPGLRKGLIVSNPKGHNFLFRWFVTKEMIKDEAKKKLFHLIKAPSTENFHLPDGYIEDAMATWSEARIQAEIFGSFDAFEGIVYGEFKRDVHVVKPFRIPDEWPRHMRQDAGYRNPAATLWFAVGPEGEVYVYREHYEKQWLVNEILNGKDERLKPHQPGIIEKSRGEKFLTAKIDPATKQRRGTTGQSEYDEWIRYWPESWPVLQLAKNDVKVGIDRVKSYLKVNQRTNRPLLYIFDTCTSLLEEITTYQYPELRPNQEGKKAENENPVKVSDHALDALRYMIVDLPEPYEVSLEDERYKKYRPIEIQLQDDLESYRNPNPKDPFGF